MQRISIIKKIKLTIAKAILNFIFALRKIFSKKQDSAIKKEKPKILLFFMSPGIGDAIMATFLISGLNKIFPDCEIDILSSAGARIIENNPLIHNIEIVSKEEQHNLKLLVKRLHHLRARHYDAAIDIPWSWEGYSAERAAFLYAIGAKNVYAANMPGFSFITNIFWDYPAETVIDIYEKALKTLVLQKNSAKKINFKRSYQIIIPQNEENIVLDYLSANGLKSYAVINPKGSLAQRCISIEKTIKLATNLAMSGTDIVLINCRKVKTDNAHLEKYGKILNFDGNIWQIAALVKHSSETITVDTSTIHIADAWSKPVLALYSENNGFGNRYVWKTHAPISPQNIVLHSYLAEDIPDDEIISAAKKLINGL